MSLSGSAVLAIWHNLLPEAREAFYEWHTREHMPERLGIAGFLRGRRYIAIEGEPEFFNLYETTQIAVLSGIDYLSRLNSPTAWTRRVVPGFRDVSRSICRVAFTDGVGQGGVMLTQCFDVTEASRPAVETALRSQILPRLVGAKGITGVHLCLTDQRVSKVQSAEAKVRGGPTLVPNFIVLIEGVAASYLQTAAREVSDALNTQRLATPINAAVYQLQYSRSHTPPKAD